MSDNTQDMNFPQRVEVVDVAQFEADTTSTEVLAWFGLAMLCFHAGLARHPRVNVD